MSEQNEASRLLPDDLLAAVFGLLAEEHVDQLQAHTYVFQAALLQLANQGHIPTLLTYFVLSKAGPTRTSPLLSEALSRLQLAGLIGRDNPEYEVIRIKDAAKSYYDTRLRPALEEQPTLSHELTLFKDELQRQCMAA